MTTTLNALTPLGASSAPLSFAEAIELRAELDGGAGSAPGDRGLIGQPIKLTYSFGLGVWRLPIRETYSIVARLAAGYLTAPQAIAEARRLRSKPEALVADHVVEGFDRLCENFLRSARERYVGRNSGAAAKLAWAQFLADSGIDDERPDMRQTLAGRAVFRIERWGELQRLVNIIPTLAGLPFMESGFDFPHDMNDLLQDERAPGTGYGSNLLDRVGAPLSVVGYQRQVSEGRDRWRRDPTFEASMLDSNVDPMELSLPSPVLAIEAEVDAELRSRVARARADERFRQNVADRFFGSRG